MMMQPAAYQCTECRIIFGVRCPYCGATNPFVLSYAAVGTTYSCRELACEKIFCDINIDPEQSLCANCAPRKVA